MPRRDTTRHDTIRINRAPVMTLWASVVAERLGFTRDEALTLGRAVAGLNAAAKGKSLGLFAPEPRSLEAARAQRAPDATLHIELLHRAVPAMRTKAGWRALAGGRPISAAGVERYLARRFGARLGEARAAMTALAHSLPPDELARRAYPLYEEFRPDIPAGLRGWGAAGDLDLDRIEGLAR